MNYENFYNLIRTGVFNELPTVPFKGANQDGLYLGRPGIDIYDMLPLLNECQMDQIANELANSYPSIPPLDHVGYALCMRLVYGKMDKNGAIRNPSNVDLSRWKLADVFLGKLMRYFVINKNIYGQCVYHEMFAHRLADLSIYYCHDRIVLNEALESYRLCSALATKCLSYKHIFSSIYWGSEYLNRCGDKRCVDWAIESLQLMDKYCPSKRYGYKAKAYAAMQIIFRMDSKKWRKILKFLIKSKQQPIRKALEKMQNYVTTSDVNAAIVKKVRDAVRSYDKKTISEKKCLSVIADIVDKNDDDRLMKVKLALQDIDPIDRIREIGGVMTI